MASVVDQDGVGFGLLDVGAGDFSHDSATGSLAAVMERQPCLPEPLECA